MTDEAKRTLLEYMSGKLESNCGDNIPQFTDLNNKTNNLEDMFKERNINFSILGFAESPKTSNILLYGNNTIGELAYGVIVVLDTDFNVLSIIEEFNSGTRFRQFVSLDFDSEGNCYGIDNIENINQPNKFRVILLNNFLIKLGNEYQVVLRNSYYFPDEYNSLYLEDPRNVNKVMKKDPINAYYSIFGRNDNTLSGRLVTLKINVGAENEWKHYDFNENLQPQLFDYSISFLENGIDFDVCVINETNFYRLENVGDVINKYFELPLGDISFGQSLIKINDNKIYLTTSKKLVDSNSYETKIMMISNNKLYEIFSETKESSYLSNICRLINKNNDCFVIRYNFRNDPNVFYNVDFYTGILLDNKYYEKYLGYFELSSYSAGNMFVKNEFNLFKICVLDVNNIKYSSLVYNSLNYNGTPCIQTNSLVPNSGILYQDNMPVFARNLYNKSLNDNLTVSTIEVPNNYLNNILVNKEILKSKTNLSLVDKNEQIIKNEYENVYVNFLNTINIRNENDPQRPVSNLTGAIRVNNSINLENDVDNTKVTKCKIVYDSGKEVIKNIQVDLANNTVTGSNPTLTNSLNKKLNYLKVEGKTVQETTKGKQLYNFQDTTNVTSGITVDKDGWITVTGDNTGGTSSKYFNYWTNNLNLQPNKEYLIVSEIKSVSGNGNFIPVSHLNPTGGQFFEDVIYSFETLTKKIYSIKKTTRESLENVSYGLRSFVSFQAGQSGSITFRLSVLEDTTITPENFVYEPYTGGLPSPRPDYPQEIKDVKGYRNLFDGLFENKTISGADGTIRDDTKRVKSVNKIYVDYKEKYTISFENDNVGFIIFEYDENNTYLGRPSTTWITQKVYTFNLIENAKYIYVVFHYNNDAVIGLDDIKNMQITEESIERPYVPYGSNYLELKANGKNFLPNLGKSQTINGINWTVNQDGSVTANGTATSNSIFYTIPTNSNIFIGEGMFTLSGCPQGGSGITFKQDIFVVGSSSAIITDFGISKYSANINKPISFSRLVIFNGYTANNLTFYPMLEKGDKATEYEPYQANSTLVNLQNNEICEEDTLIVQNGYASIDKNKKILELTGEEINWLENTATRGLFQITLKNVSVDLTRVHAISTHFIGNKGTDIAKPTDYIDNSVSTYSGNRLFFRVNSYANNLNGFKQFLKDQKAKGTPVIVQYELANKENIGLGLQEQLTSYDNVTYVSCDDDLQPNLEVNYLINENYSTLSTTIYVDELLKELQFISNDEKTVYQTIDVSNLQVGNYYTIKQRMEVK